MCYHVREAITEQPLAVALTSQCPGAELLPCEAHGLGRDRTAAQQWWGAEAHAANNPGNGFWGSRAVVAGTRDILPKGARVRKRVT